MPMVVEIDRLCSLGTATALINNVTEIIVIIIIIIIIYIALFSYPFLALYNNQVNIEPKTKEYNKIPR